MKIKHSKYKNTGILFELLTRQITSDTVSGKSNKSLEFLKKHFNSKTELLKEYKIYHTLSSKKYAKDSQATMLIETLIEAHKNLNKSKLRREKYNLIKEIKDTYDVNNFFNSKISNYKIMASIYNLLENKEASPSSIVKSKINLLEHIILKKQTLLKEYVNSVTNSPSLKAYINEEIKKVKRDITKYAKKITDKAVVIKLNETKGLIKPLCKKSSVHDDNVSNLLNYYELINELKTIHG
jgi:hypothetical protein